MQATGELDLRFTGPPQGDILRSNRHQFMPTSRNGDQFVPDRF